MSLLLLESDLTLHIPQSLQITNKGTIYLPRIYKQCFTKHVSEKVSSYKQGSLCCKSKVLLCPLAMCPRVSAWNFKKPVSNIADLGALAKSHPNTFTCKHPVSLWIHNYLFVSYFIGNKISQICYSQSIIPNLGSYIFFLSNAQEWYVISLRRKSTELYSTTHRRHKPTAQIFGMQYLSQLSFLVKAVLFLPCHTFLPEKLFTKLNFPRPSAVSWGESFV